MLRDNGDGTLTVVQGKPFTVGDDGDKDMSITLDEFYKQVIEPVNARIEARIMEEITNQLHAARYTFHKVVVKKYGDQVVSGQIGLEQAQEMYRLAMANYDGIIDAAANGHLTEANQADMDKGFVL